MTSPNLENIAGNLRGAYNLAVPGTVLHVDELMNERRTNDALLSQWFYPADGIIYRMNDKGTPELGITREPENLVLRHLNDETNNSFDQLMQTGNYRADPAEVQQVMAAESTVIIDLTKLRLLRNESEYHHVEVSTTKYDKLNPEERKLAERVYGQGNDFTAIMNMLKDAGIGQTRIHVLSPDYVRKEAAQGLLGRASWLGNFDYFSDFGADDRHFDYGYCVRGVRKKSSFIGNEVSNI